MGFNMIVVTWNRPIPGCDRMQKERRPIRLDPATGGASP